MSRALVTGAAGFIGGALARALLAEGWEVHALLGSCCRTEALADVHGRVRLHIHDGSMEGMSQILRDSRPDVVFHLASLFLSEHRPEDISSLITSNVLLSTQLAEAMVGTGTSRLVNTGTSWQHFHCRGYRPVNLYAATKQAFEDILAYYHEAHGLSVITLKLYDTYGSRDPRRKLVPLLLESVRAGASMDLSPGEQTLDLLHVEDVVSGFMQAARRLQESPDPRLETFLMGGTRLTVRELAQRIACTAGRTFEAHWGQRPYRLREVMEPVDPGTQLPGWVPKVPLDVGLAAAYHAMESA